MRNAIKHTYLISAYKDPAQLHRLMSVLDADNVSFFLHIDKKSDDKLFKKTLASFNDKTQYIKREKISWGGFGIVKATINGFKAINKIGDYDYLHFLSAQDYPIKSKNEIDAFFIENNGKSFLSYFSLPSDNWIYGGMNRIEDYYMGNRRSYSKLHRKLLDHFNRFVRKTGVFKRSHPDNLVPFGGEGALTLHKSAVEYILEFLKNNPQLLKFHKYSFAPSEMIFHTILLNSENDHLRKNIVNNLLWYIDWSKAGDGGSPAVFGIDDFVNIKNSDKFFARKFDIKYDSKILDLIDKELLENR